MSGSDSTVKSPCMGLCSLFDGVCMGCFRDINEISDWHDMNDEQRRKVLAETEQRRKEFEALEKG